jgi:hypothetical protein
MNQDETVLTRPARIIAESSFRLSVPDSEALPNVRGLFQFVDHRDRIILNRDAALAAGIEQELIASQAEFAGALARLHICRRGQIGPFELRLLSQLLQRINR